MSHFSSTSKYAKLLQDEDSTSHPSSRYAKVIQEIISCEDPMGFRFDAILEFFELLGRKLTPEDEADFRKRYNPANKENIPCVIALQGLLSFCKEEDLILALETEALVLNKKSGNAWHNVEDLRWMLNVVGEPVPPAYSDHFVKEALGRSEDLLELNCYIETICKTPPPIDTTKKAKSRN
jgi:hypothetical protein